MQIQCTINITIVHAECYISVKFQDSKYYCLKNFLHFYYFCKKGKIEFQAKYVTLSCITHKKSYIIEIRHNFTNQISNLNNFDFYTILLQKCFSS